jgi:hypothetical protein
MNGYLDWVQKSLIGYGADPNTILTPKEWARLDEYDPTNESKDENGLPEIPMDPDQKALDNKLTAALHQAREDYYRKHPSVDLGLVK